MIWSIPYLQYLSLYINNGNFNLEEENIQQSFLCLPRARDRMAPLGLPGSSSSVVVSLKFISSKFTVTLWVFLRCELCSCNTFVSVI